jgi:hypothetical protein
MTIKEAIQEIKATLVSLTAEQIQDKKVLREPHNGNTWEVMMRAWARAAEITIYLNLYNQLRNKPDRHSTEKYDAWMSGRFKSRFAKYEELVLDQTLVEV